MAAAVAEALSRCQTGFFLSLLPFSPPFSANRLGLWCWAGPIGGSLLNPLGSHRYTVTVLRLSMPFSLSFSFFYPAFICA